MWGATGCGFDTPLSAQDSKGASGYSAPWASSALRLLSTVSAPQSSLTTLYLNFLFLLPLLPLPALLVLVAPSGSSLRPAVLFHYSSPSPRCCLAPWGYPSYILCFCSSHCSILVILFSSSTFNQVCSSSWTLLYCLKHCLLPPYYDLQIKVTFEFKDFAYSELKRWILQT